MTINASRSLSANNDRLKKFDLIRTCHSLDSSLVTLPLSDLSTKCVGAMLNRKCEIPLV